MAMDRLVDGVEGVEGARSCLDDPVQEAFLHLLASVDFWRGELDDVFSINWTWHTFDGGIPIYQDEVGLDADEITWK